METGIEPVCTALQAVASPLGHSTVGLMPQLHLRADDGIRTRDPHLGKVMRYQLRYIRKAPGELHPLRCKTIVHGARSGQIGSVNRGFQAEYRAVLVFDLGTMSCWRRRGPVAQWESVRFTRGRSLVRSQPGPPPLIDRAFGPLRVGYRRQRLGR